MINSKYKDSLFRKIFSDKKDLLSLYNALDSSNHADEDALEITTLEDAVWMKYKNDISFIISNRMNLYEHQSTLNPNMPLRGVRYFASLYNAYVDKNKFDIYGSKLIKLPAPMYIVFYNGTANIPEKVELKLSDAFEKPADDPSLECKVLVLNINLGHNEDLLEKCKTLLDYSKFVDKMLEMKIVFSDSEIAAKNTVDWCIENDVLKEFLQKNSAEVLETMIFKYDEELHIANEKEISRQEGRIETIIALLKEGIIDLKIASEKLEISEEEVKKML